MRQQGEITDKKNGMLEITFCRLEACAACNACEGGKREHKIWIKGNGRVGDIAIVDMPDQMIVKASAVAYGLPLAGLMAGMLIASAITGENTWGMVIGAALGLGISMAILKMTEKNRSTKPEWNPRVVDIMERSPKNGDQGE